jgi:hypothetical protein
MSSGWSRFDASRQNDNASHFIEDRRGGSGGTAGGRHRQNRDRSFGGVVGASEV